MVGYQHVIHSCPEEAHACARPGMALQFLDRYPESITCYRNNPSRGGIGFSPVLTLPS